jgi:predicted metal-dependent hydrolase
MFKFGLTHEVTRDSVKMFKDFKKILDEEKNIHDYMLNQSLSIDKEECFKLLEKLEELNEKTVKYYYEAFGDIIDACSTNFPDRARHMSKNFNTLIESDEYRKCLEGLTIGLRSIKLRLDFEDEFWDYIDDKTYILNKDEIDNCGIREDDNGFSIYVPSIVSLETANMNMQIFMEAYKKIDKSFYMKKKDFLR